MFNNVNLVFYKSVVQPLPCVTVFVPVIKNEAVRAAQIMQKIEKALRFIFIVGTNSAAYNCL